MVSDSTSCLCGSVFFCIYMKGALRVNPLPAPETGNGSNMGMSVASIKALGSDLVFLSGLELQEQCT